jgi:hypothetical protein
MWVELECFSCCEMSKFGWNWLFEPIPSFEVSECGWKVINWLIEIMPSCEVSECGWKIIN